MANPSTPLDQRSLRSVDGQKKKRKKPVAGGASADAVGTSATSSARKAAGSGTSKIRSPNVAPTYSAFPGGSTSSLHLPSSAAYNSVVGNASAIASSETLGYSTQPEPLFLPPSRSYAQGVTTGSNSLLKPESPGNRHRKSPSPSDAKGKGRATQDSLSPSVTYNTTGRSSDAIRKLSEAKQPSVDIMDAVRFAGLMPPPQIERSVSQDAANSPYSRSPGLTELARTTSAQSANTASETASLRGTIASTSSAVDTGAESLKQQPAKKKKKAKIFPEQKHTRPKEPFTQVIIGSALTNANLDVRRPNAMGSMATQTTAGTSQQRTQRPATARAAPDAGRREERAAARRPRRVEPAQAGASNQANAPEGSSRTEQSSISAASASQANPAVQAAAPSASVATPAEGLEEPLPPPWTAPQSTITLAFTPMHAYITDFDNGEAQADDEPDVPDSPTTAAFMAALGQSSPSVSRTRQAAQNVPPIPNSPPPAFRSRPPSPQEAVTPDEATEWPDLDPDSISLRSRGYASSEDENDLLTSAGRGLGPSGDLQVASDANSLQTRRRRIAQQVRRWEAWRREGVDAETRWQRISKPAPEVGLPAVQLPEPEQSAEPAALDSHQGAQAEASAPSAAPPMPIADPPVTTSTTAELVARVQAARIPETSTLLRPQQHVPVREPSPAPSGSSSSEPRSSPAGTPNATSSTSAPRFPSIGTVRRARLARFEAQRQNSKTMSSVIDLSPSSSAVSVPRQVATEAAKVLPETNVVSGTELAVQAETSRTAQPAAHQLAKRLSAEIEARNAQKPLAVASSSEQSTSSPVAAASDALPHVAPAARPASPGRQEALQPASPTTPKAKRKSAGTMANRISRLIRPQKAAAIAAESSAKEPPEMTLPRAPPRVTTDPLSEDNLRRLSRHQERPTNLRSSLSHSSSSEAESEQTSESSFDNAKSDSDSDSADDESTRKPASTLVSYPAGAPPPSVSAASSALPGNIQKEVAAASWRRTEDGRRHSALLSRPLSIKRKPPPVPAKRWGGIWDKSVRLFDSLEEEFNNALDQNSPRMPGSFLSKVAEDDEGNWQTVGQPEGLSAPRLPTFAWETAGRDDVPVRDLGRAGSTSSLRQRIEAGALPRSSLGEQQLPRRLPPLPDSMVSAADQVLHHDNSHGRDQDNRGRSPPSASTSRIPDDGSFNDPHHQSSTSPYQEYQSAVLQEQEADPVSIEPLRRPSAASAGSLRRAPATRRPQSVSYPRQESSTPSSPSSSAYPGDATRASLNARPKHVYSASLPTNNIPTPVSRPRRPLPTPPADVTLPAGVVPAFQILPHGLQTSPPNDEATAKVTASSAMAVEPETAPLPELAELDTILSEIEGTGVSAQTAEEILGLTRPATAAEIDSLPVGRVELERKRIDKNGKVKQKLSCVGINCNKCNICLIQFKEDELAAVLPLCCHVFHAEPCIRSYLSTNNRCPSCQTPLM